MVVSVKKDSFCWLCERANFLMSRVHFFFSISLIFINCLPYGKNIVFSLPGDAICYSLLCFIPALTGTVALTETYIQEKLKEKGP